MAALLKLVPRDLQMSDVPAALGANPWAAATDAKRRVAELRHVVVAPLVALVQAGASINHAAALLASRAAAGTLDPATAHALDALGTDATSVPTLKRWISAAKAHGKAGLLPAHTGRVRKGYGWEQRAVALYNIPSKPGFADVAWRLRSEGHESATESRVKRYLKSLPATLGPNSPGRIGPHLHRLTRQKYQRRSVAELLVGEIYAGDGHTADCYVAHPNTGKPFRPELTCFIDIKSRAIPGWYFTESESAQSTLFALSAAMLQHDHVPAWLYIDRGAGYRAKMLSDEATGWYKKFDIDVIGALPGNPHGKGWIERFFRTVRDKHDKTFMDGAVYCGDDMAPETNRRLSADLAAGRRTLPSLAEYVASFRAFIADYHREPMDVLGGRTPAQVWAELTPVALEMPAEAVLRPSDTAVVRRQVVRLHNREYFAEALALYDGHRVTVEYDLHDDSRVWVCDSKGRFVVEAKRVNTIGVLPTSRIEEGRDRRLAGQRKRLERKLAEVSARRQDVITAEHQVRAISDLAGPHTALPDTDPAAGQADEQPDELQALPAIYVPPEPPADKPGDEPVVDIDLLDWSDDK